MSDKKISELPVASASNSTDIFVINQGGVSKTVARSLMPSGDFLSNGSVPMTGDLDFDGNDAVRVRKILDTSGNDAINIGSRLFLKTSGSRILDLSTGFKVGTSSENITFDLSALTTGRNIAWRDLSGTVAYTSDIPVTHFKGVYTSLVALQTAVPTGISGDYAVVDAGIGTDAINYIWDNDDSDWVQGGGGVGVTSVSGTANKITSTGGATPVIDIAANPVIAGIQGMVIPAGATADRNVSPTAGTIRYNTTTLAFECYYGGVWNTLATSIDADPSAPSPDGVEYYESVTDGVKTWERVPVVSGTSVGNKTKLQAGASGDWINGSYVGATSGVTSGTFGGEKFIGQDATDTYYYNYEALQNDVWVRSLAVAQGSGIIRSISNVSGVTSTLGATVKTDYVVICTGTNTLTLPTAVGNANQYTIKLTSGTTTLNTTSSQTIDGSTSISLTVAYTSLTLISNNTNWVII
jgi:hypothetical protein